MSQARALNVVLLVVMLLATACDGRQPTSPTLPTESPVSSPPRTSLTFEVTGIVTADAGAPVPGARVAIWDDYADLPVVRTDDTGRYTLKFSGVPGSNQTYGRAGNRSAGLCNSPHSRTAA